MIQETIDEINGLLLASFSEAQKQKKIQLAGVAQEVYDQQAKGIKLILPMDDNKRLVLDNSYSWQSAHLLGGGDVISAEDFGSFKNHHYGLSMMLIGCSKRPSGLAKALGFLEQTSNIQIDRFENNTLEVLGRYWRQPADDSKNYDPSWWAFAIRYRILGVSGAEFGDFYNLFDDVTI